MKANFGQVSKSSLIADDEVLLMPYWFLPDSSEFGGIKVGRDSSQNNIPPSGM